MFKNIYLIIIGNFKKNYIFIKVKFWLNMRNFYVKHPIFVCVISFILVFIAGYLKKLKLDIADLLIQVTYTLAVISLIYALIRINVSRKKYSDLAN